MRLIISFAALLMSIALLQLSSGAVSPLDAISGGLLGFTDVEIGLLGSAHYLGFFIGCWLAPRLLGRVGHARTFILFAVSGVVGLVGHPLAISPEIWAALRVLTGFCIAGCYTVVEGWMQSRLSNHVRGRVMGVYRFIDITASSLAQLMIGVLEPAHYTAYNILALIACACLLPLTLTASQQPTIPLTPRLRPLHTIRLSPLGALGVVVSGTTSAAFRMVGPVYAASLGLSNTLVGYFLATVLISGAVAQLSVGWLADRFDRRHVLVWLSVASALSCAFLMLLSMPEQLWVFIGAAMFGAVTMPIFSISAAHTNDFAKPEESTEVNASLIFLFGVGATISPVISASLMQQFGPGALFGFILIAHVVLVGYSIMRMAVRGTRRIRTRYASLPSTTFLIGGLLKRGYTTKPGAGD